MKLRRRDILVGAGASAFAGPTNARTIRGSFRLSGASLTAPTPPGSPFVTAVITPGTVLTTFTTTQYGYQLTTGPVPLTVTALGRLALTGNNQTHRIQIFSAASGQTEVFTGNTVVNMSGSTPGTFVYATPNLPQGYIILWENTSYYIICTEVTGTDSFLDKNTVVTTTTDATINDSAFFNVGTFIVGGGSGLNKPYVPLNFKYTLGTPGQNVARPGTIFDASQSDRSVLSLFQPFLKTLGGTVTQIAAGTVNFVGEFLTGNPPSGATFTYQWMLDGAPLTAVFTGTDPFLIQPINTLTAMGGSPIPDGTHIIYPRFLDCSNFPIGYMSTMGIPIIVANSGFNSGAQTAVPVAAIGSNNNPSSMPDFINYTGNPNPIRATFAFPSTGVIPGNSSSSLRVMDGTNYWNEIWPGPRNRQYGHDALWNASLEGTGAAGGGGGVFAGFFDWETDFSTEGAYLPVLKQNSMDGTRLNTWISPISNYAEDPAGGNVWWGVEANGRVFRLDPNGTVTTIFGRTRDRTRLSFLYNTMGLNETNMDPKISNIGTFPVDFDSLGGANDLCFDPRDPNILYVVAQVDSFIAKIHISTQTATLYAGQVGVQSYTDNANPLAAAFNNPSSIIMDSTGIMYVCDQVNQAIRKIASTATSSPIGGAVTTLCGGTVGPTPPTNAQLQSSTNYSASSFTWNSGTNIGTVVMATATTIKLGYTLALSGAIAPAGSSGDPNTNAGSSSPRYVVLTFTDSQHFTVGFEPSRPGKPTITTGSFTGSPVFTKYTMDDFSSPTLVAFASATLCNPNVIRFSSNGDIIFGEQPTKCCRRIFLSGGSSGSISRIGVQFNQLDVPNAIDEWVWLAVNTAGTIGPVDDILFSSIHGDTSHSTWRFSLDGTYSALGMTDPGAVPSEGPMGDVIAGPGHYPWAVTISTHEGRLITSGVANVNPSVIRLRKAGDYVINNTTLNSPPFENGFLINVYGSPIGFPPNMRPSFSSLRGTSGGSWIMDDTGHNTFEELCNTFPTAAGLIGYIQAGMGGAVPRPEMTTTCRGAIEFEYFIRRGSLSGAAPPTPYSFPGYPADNSTPIVTAISANRVDGTHITVNWTTDKSTIGCAVAASPGQYAMAAAFALYGLHSPMNAAFATSHSETILVPSGATPMHYTVVVMDTFGNFSYTIDQTVA